MRLGTVHQQPGERDAWSVDYGDDMSTGDEVANATITIDPPGLVLDDHVCLPTRVRLWLTGGTIGTTYTVFITASTKDGRIMKDQFFMKIRDF